jgi:uncharacterized protein YdeI (YjbR/CyaY-like superfamily)
VAIDVAKDNGSWAILDIDELIEPDDLAAALDAVADAHKHWDAFPPSAKKTMLWWVKGAARDHTRAERITTIVTRAQNGNRVAE